jgi:hypothetical protein
MPKIKVKVVSKARGSNSSASSRVRITQGRNVPYTTSGHAIIVNKNGLKRLGR